MKTYKLKLTAISPIHIGTGEEYEPINYVIDKLDIKTPDGKIVKKDYMSRLMDKRLQKQEKKSGVEITIRKK